MSIKGKRLLHVGGALFQVPAVECAKRNGCFVVLIDQDTEAPASEFADVFEQVSTVDFEGALRIAREYEVDGIMTYASDSSTPTVAYVADKLGLPGNPPEAARILQGKDFFRKFQQDNGLHHPRFFAVSDWESASMHLKDLTFPLVVKPADSAGTKGQSVIYAEREAHKAFEIAMSQSRRACVVFEEFVDSDMLELDGDVLAKDGDLAFRHYGHNFFLKNRISNVPSGECFPGFYGDEVSEQLDRQFRTIIKELGLKNASMNFDGLYANGKAYIIDVAIRSGGNYVPDLIKLSTGFDITEAAIYGALGVDYPCDSLFREHSSPVASYLIGSRFTGKFEGIDFSDEIKDYLVDLKMFVQEGETVLPYTYSGFSVGLAFFKFPDMEACRHVVENMEDLVDLKVISSKTEVDIEDLCKSFPELLSPFLRVKLAQAEAENNETVKRVISRQYLQASEETHVRNVEELKHYEASEHPVFEGVELSGVERLYSRVILFEPLYQCMAHCRFCLRRNYSKFHQNRDDICRAARFIGKAEGHEELREVLVTGGDPFLVPDKIELFLNQLTLEAPQIEIVRIATRLPVQQPDRITDELIGILGADYPFRIEVATQINHATEFFPEVEDAFKRILDVVRVIYNQTVLLAGVNDTLDELIALCNKLRDAGIENHYLFHCVPIAGLNDLRPSLIQSIELVRALSSCGRISGRSKPQLALMTSIGKITLYEGTILEHKDNKFLLQSNYAYKDRRHWNPNWDLPQNTEVGDDGLLRVWYEDRLQS